MEKRPTLTRGYDGQLTLESCYLICKYMAEEAEMNDEAENAKDWLLEANLYKAELDMRLQGYSRNPMIQREIERNHDAWAAVTVQVQFPKSA